MGRHSHSPKPDDSGATMIAVIAILATRINEPLAFAGILLALAAIISRWGVI